MCCGFDPRVTARDQTRDLDLAIGIILVAFSVPTEQRRADTRHLIYGLDNFRGLKVVRESVALGVNIGRYMMRDLSCVSAQAYVTIEGDRSEPHRPAFLSSMQYFPKSNMMTTICARPSWLLKRKVFATTLIEKITYGGVAVGPTQHDAADDLYARP